MGCMGRILNRRYFWYVVGTSQPTIKLEAYETDLFYAQKNGINVVPMSFKSWSQRFPSSFNLWGSLAFFFVSVQTLSNEYIHTFSLFLGENGNISWLKNHLQKVILREKLLCDVRFGLLVTTPCNKMHSSSVSAPMMPPNQRKHPILPSLLVNLCSYENFLITYCVLHVKGCICHYICFET